MDCKQVRALLSAYVDGELDARSSMEVEEHLRSCESCRAALEATRQTKQAVIEKAAYYRAPAALQKTVKASTHELPRRTPSFASAVGFAACLLLVFGAGWLLGRARPQSPDEASLLVASHVRALMSDHLADVISTDKHTVKPWFNGKVDYSPPVNDLADQGFPLKGGRLEYLNGRRVAVLVYGRAKHVIDIYIEPSDQSAKLTEQSINGFNELHWASGGFDFWAVSDLNPTELRQFAALVGRDQ